MHHLGTPLNDKSLPTVTPRNGSHGHYTILRDNPLPLNLLRRGLVGRLSLRRPGQLNNNRFNVGKIIRLMNMTRPPPVTVGNQNGIRIRVLNCTKQRHPTTELMSQREVFFRSRRQITALDRLMDHNQSNKTDPRRGTIMRNGPALQVLVSLTS